MAPEVAPQVQLDAERIHAVVFDMDGVITDTARAHESAWKRMFDEFLSEYSGTNARLDPFTHGDYLRYVDGKPRDDGVGAFLDSRGIALPRGEGSDPPQRVSIWGLANRKNREFLRTLREEGVEAFPSSVALVRELQHRNVGTAVVSASRNAQRVLDAAGIGDLFPVRVDGIDLERLGLPGKPAPDMFLAAVRRLDVEPARAAVVEDAIAGVQAGRAGAFSLVIGVDRGQNADALRANGADAVVGDLGEIVVVH